MKKIYLKDLTVKEIIDRLQNGDVIHLVTRNYKECTFMVNGTLVEHIYKERDGKQELDRVNVNANLMLNVSDDDFHYFLEDDGLSVSVGKLYLTNKGRKIFVYGMAADYFNGILVEEFMVRNETSPTIYCINDKGEIFSPVIGKSGEKLVEELV